jgi:DNA-binding MarR family transcriptional regulator
MTAISTASERSNAAAPTELDIRVAVRLRDLMRELMIVMNQRSVGDTLAIMNKAKLSMPQMVAMHLLDRLGPHTISAIADRLRLSRAATSHLVDRLVRAKLVMRKEGTSDRREKRAEITGSGRSLLAQINQSREREMDRVFARLSPRVRKDLEGVMAAMIEELSRESVRRNNVKA